MLPPSSDGRGDDTVPAPDNALIALLGALLREGAHDPLSLLADSAEPAVVRIARRGESAVSPFDELLVEAYESGSAELVAHLTRKVGSRNDAEDIVQTAFMRVYARRPDHIADVGMLRGYLWTTAENLLRDEWRRRSKERQLLDPAGEDRIALLAERSGLPLDDLIALRQTLIAALGTLAPREREAVVVRAYEGNTFAETARIMGISAGTVKAYVHGALAKVRAGVDLS